MNKINFPLPSLTHPPQPASDVAIGWPNMETARRLIVLISADVDSSSVTPRIWELANATGSTVQLLGLARDASQQPSLCRELITMSALIRDAKVCVETKVEIGADWVEAVRRNYQMGDMIVCMAGQRTGIRRRPLSQMLHSNLKVPVYILSELPQSLPKSSGLSQVVTWSGFIAIILAFFLLQVKVAQLPQDGYQTVLFILLLIPEFWLIWIWNSLFG